MLTLPPLKNIVVTVVAVFTLVMTGVPHANPTPVAVAQIQQVELAEPVQLVGSVLPLRDAPLSVQVAGLVQEIWVDEGAQVKQGDRLLQLDDQLARIAVDRRSAELAQAQAELAEAQRKLDEAIRLREQGHIPVSALETAQTSQAVAAAVQGQVEADLAAAQENLQRHMLRAPFAGTVTRKQAELGQWLNTGSAAFQLIDTDNVRVEVAVPQAQIAAVSLGTRASIALDAFPNLTWESSVSAVIPRDTANARTVPVWLSVANPQGTLLPGMSARVRLGLANAEPLALAVPNDALVRRADGAVLVWLVRDAEPDLVVEAVQVTLGRRDASFTEVVSTALQPGDRVVFRGNESLRPGQAVYVVEGYMVGGR